MSDKVCSERSTVSDQQCEMFEIDPKEYCVKYLEGLKKDLSLLQEIHNRIKKIDNETCDLSKKLSDKYKDSGEGEEVMRLLCNIGHAEMDLDFATGYITEFIDWIKK